MPAQRGTTTAPLLPATTPPPAQRDIDATADMVPSPWSAELAVSPWSADLVSSPWSASLFKDGVPVTTEKRHVLDIEYVTVKVVASVDPTSIPVAISLRPAQVVPASGDWLSAAWTGAATFANGQWTAYARTASPYTPSDVATLRTRARISAAPETVVLDCGAMTFYS